MITARAGVRECAESCAVADGVDGTAGAAEGCWGGAGGTYMSPMTGTLHSRGTISGYTQPEALEAF